MTVRTASLVGMEPVVEMISRMGIGKHEPYLSTALGAGSTTVEKITNAYAMLANHGRALKPRVIDYEQDRRGKGLFPKNWKPCEIGRASCRESVCTYVYNSGGARSL